MYYHLSPWIYLATYNSVPIMLDLKKDRYTILENKYFTSLIKILETSFETLQLDKELFLVATTLKKQKIILSNLFANKQNSNFEGVKSSSGVFDLMWDPDNHNARVEPNLKLVFKSYLILIKVFFLKKISFYMLINFINKAKTIYCPVRHKFKKETLVSSLNWACKFFPQKVRCLEWAATLAVLGQYSNYNTQFVIGIQLNPFMAHAWVEFDREIIHDSPMLKEKLSKILVIPSRPKK